MSINSREPTSRRGYLSQLELEEFANITVTDTTEADDRISQAEEMIDNYVGFQDQYFHEIVGYLASSASTTSHTLETKYQNIYDIDYFKGLEIEIIGGTNAGQRKKITASTKEGVITTDAFSSALSSSSYFRIYQVGKFPRKEDVYYNSEHTPAKYFKTIPDKVRRAVASQVEFMISMGDAYFSGDSADKQSESIGDYSYTKAQTGMASSLHSKMVAPKARQLLHGIVNRKGQFC